MIPLQEMLRNVTSTPDHDRMIRSVAPFCDCFGINHMYYVRILSSGLGTILGTHVELHEYLYENIDMVKSCPVLRQPDVLPTGVTILGDTPDLVYQQFLDHSWKNYQVNFTINIQKQIPEGVEAWGFGVMHNHPQANARLLNELPLIHKFMDYFRKENGRLIRLAHDNQVDMAKLLGTNFFESASPYPISAKKDLLLKQLGLGSALLLTARELDVMKFLACGYPASYIAKQLHLSVRTVENHIATIKSKLECDSRAILIKTANEIVSIIH